ncbi:Acyl carrier protein [Corynebacterium massiliense DSM 45435]|uniref:Acyl carrier protein n=2 Tax=Corynebacterium massiliense TaxID=441501 RepID=A0ABY7U882_9CORY|nr:Acyl carrier protein [Corynebacterium massiliense DSM 45435]
MPLEAVAAKSACITLSGMSNDLEAQLKAHFNSDAAPADAPGNEPESTFAEVVQLVSKATGVSADDIERESSLEDLGATSLALIELTVRMEQEFGVRFEEKTAAGFTTVGEVVDYVDARRKQNQSAQS